MMNPSLNSASTLWRNRVVEEFRFQVDTYEIRRILMDRLVVLETAMQQIEALRRGVEPGIAREIASMA